MQIKKLKKLQGFIMIELIVAVIAIGILAAYTIPEFMDEYIQ